MLLDAGTGYDNYLWSTGDTTQTIYASNSGSYSVNVGNKTSSENDFSMHFDYFNSESWWVNSITGKILLFPSKLAHNVEENESDLQRISIAINTFVTGYMGDNLDKTGLNL